MRKWCYLCKWVKGILRVLDIIKDSTIVSESSASLYSLQDLDWSALGPHRCRWGSQSGQCQHCSVWWWGLFCEHASCKRWKWASHQAERVCRGLAMQWNSDEKYAAPLLSKVGSKYKDTKENYIGHTFLHSIILPFQILVCPWEVEEIKTPSNILW